MNEEHKLVKMTLTQRDRVTPTEGMLIEDKDTGRVHFYGDGVWMLHTQIKPLNIRQMKKKYRIQFEWIEKKHMEVFFRGTDKEIMYFDTIGLAEIYINCINEEGVFNSPFHGEIPLEGQVFTIQTVYLPETIKK